MPLKAGLEQLHGMHAIHNCHLVNPLNLTTPSDVWGSDNTIYDNELPYDEAHLRCACGQKHHAKTFGGNVAQKAARRMDGLHQPRCLRQALIPHAHIVPSICSLLHRGLHRVRLTGARAASAGVCSRSRLSEQQ